MGRLAAEKSMLVSNTARAGTDDHAWISVGWSLPKEESFDHLVSSPEQFDHFDRYIANNPEKVGLRPGGYLHYCRSK